MIWLRTARAFVIAFDEGERILISVLLAGSKARIYSGRFGTADRLSLDFMRPEGLVTNIDRQ